MKQNILTGILLKSLITAVLVILMALPEWQMAPHCMTLHFLHANIYHLLSNLMCLWLLPIRGYRLLDAYAIAVLAAMLPYPHPFVGLSGVLFAYIGIMYGRHNASRQMGNTLLIAIITGLMPDLALGYHLVTILLGYVTGQTIRFFRG